MKAFYLIIFSIIILLNDAFARETRPSSQATPTWVTQNTYDYAPTHLDKAAEDGYVDIAAERQYHIPSQSTYNRNVKRVLNDAGVQNSSDISVSFDPSFSRLTFHTINIIRGGKAINCLDLKQFKMVQKETELSRHIYNGAISAELFLEDVRRGDVIDYSYTISGWNPVMSDKFSSFLPTSFAYPFYHVYYKIVTPAARPLQIKDILSKVEFSAATAAGQTVYEWKLADLKPIHEEDKTPVWFSPYNYAMVSEYKSWQEVAEWAMRLYPANIPVSGGLKKLVDEIVERNQTDEGRLLAALHFVQDEVRYMGIEMGTSSHRPHDPAQIFRQRYGDCKDKAYLLCAMLRAMHIAADPVLIASDDRHTIADYLPSPRDFDHVTVRAQLGNKYYWLDPTITGQRGRLEDISFPNYEIGLLVSPNTTGLTTIPLQDKARKQVTETIDIPDMSGNARLTVVSRYWGSEADDARSSFDGSSYSEIQRFYKDYYAPYFNKIEADSITTSDDPATGVFECREYYSLHDIWKIYPDKQNTWFYAYVINGDFHKPANKSRSSPFAMNYPLRCTEDVIINLPDDWDLKGDEADIECSAFRMKARITYLLRQLRMHYEFETLKDYVDAKELPEYLAAYEKADDISYYGIRTGTGTHTEGGDEEDGPSGRTPGAVYTLLALIAIITGVVIRARKQR